MFHDLHKAKEWTNSRNIHGKRRYWNEMVINEEKHRRTSRKKGKAKTESSNRRSLGLYRSGRSLRRIEAELKDLEKAARAREVKTKKWRLTNTSTGKRGVSINRTPFLRTIGNWARYTIQSLAKYLPSHAKTLVVIPPYEVHRRTMRDFRFVRSREVYKVNCGQEKKRACETLPYAATLRHVDLHSF